MGTFGLLHCTGAGCAAPDVSLTVGPGFLVERVVRACGGCGRARSVGADPAGAPDEPCPDCGATAVRVDAALERLVTGRTATVPCSRCGAPLTWQFRGLWD